MAIFIDTSFLIALVIENDALHARAVAWKNHLRDRLVTSEFILLEVADGLSKPSRKSLATDIFQSVEEDRHIDIVRLESEWRTRGFHTFRERGDKEWGLTDCISFESMRARGITQALTYDHHFEQAGFQALLRSEPPAA